MPIIPIAMALMQFAPSLMKLFGASEPTVATASKIIGIAQTVTGTATPEEALAAMKASQEHQAAFAMAAQANEQELTLALLADVQSARERDAQFITSGKHNYRADTMFVLAVLVTLLLVWIVWKDPSISEYVKGIFTLVLGRFLGYLDNIYNFEFGTTRSSRSKDDTISNLSKGS